MKNPLRDQSLQVYFVDHTTAEPVVLAQSTFPFLPVFNPKDRLSFKNEPGVKTATHVVEDTYWCFDTIDQEGKNFPIAIPGLIVNLKKIEPRRTNYALLSSLR